jgi:hypothetical protein
MKFVNFEDDAALSNNFCSLILYESLSVSLLIWAHEVHVVKEGSFGRETDRPNFKESNGFPQNVFGSAKFICVASQIFR